MKLYPAMGSLEVVAIYILGPFPKSRQIGYNNVLVNTHRYYKMAFSVPKKTFTARTFSEAFLEQWVLRYGIPYRLFADSGTQLVAKLFDSVRLFLHIYKSTTTAYRPHSNGNLNGIVVR